MMQLMARIFSDKYVNHTAIGGNQLLWFMYRFAFPFAFVLNRLRCTPNQITSLSTILAMLAAVSLIYDLNAHWFVIFWTGSLLLDFCDGTVARMTGNISKTALRYDHVSDLFKIFIVMLAAGLQYDSLSVWLSAMTASFAFMYYIVLNHELSTARKNLEKLENEAHKDIHDQQPLREGRFHFVKKLIKNDLLLKCLRSAYIALTTINGHTLLLFLFIPFGSELTIAAFSYLITLSTLGIIARILALRKIPR